MSAAAARAQEVGLEDLRQCIASGGLVLVEFWAPWCVQCGPMAAVVERLAQQLPAEVAVLKVSVEDERVAEEFGIMTLPALQLFAEGGAIAQLTGFRGPAAIMEVLRPHIRVASPG